LNWKPNKWIALVLGLVTAQLGVLYAGYPLLAALLLVLQFVVGALVMGFAGKPSAIAIIAIGLGFYALCVTLSYVLANRAAPREKRPFYTRWYGLIGVALTVVMLIGALRGFLFEPFRAASSSMAPTADTGALLVVQKWGSGRIKVFGFDFGRIATASPLERGQIVVFDYPVDPSTPFIMRVVGIPGDTVTYKERRLYINGTDTRGRQLDDYQHMESLQTFSRFEENIGASKHQILLSKEPQTPPPPGDFPHKESCTFAASETTCLVPQGHYFVLGDNRDNSNDSRFWGFVPSTAVIGKVIRISRAEP